MKTITKAQWDEWALANDPTETRSIIHAGGPHIIVAKDKDGKEHQWELTD